MSRQNIEVNHWNVILKENKLVGSGSQISEYDIKDGDKVGICREIELDAEELEVENLA